MIEGLSFRVLDRFSITHCDREVPLRVQKQKAILAWFLLTGEASITRERMADLLWSGAASDKSRGSLRNTLHLLPGLPELETPQDMLRSDRASLHANFRAAPCNITSALRAWDDGDASGLLRMGLGDAETRFAADLWGLDAEFDQFLADQRRLYLATMAEAFRTRLRACAAPSEHSRILAERLRELQPQDELATRHLMLLEIAAGNNAAALSHYDRLWAVLDQDFDIEPSEETQSLAVAIKLQTAGPASVPVAAPVEQRRITIFLYPFPIISLPYEDQIAVGGVQAELVSALFAVEDWVTIEASPDMPLPKTPGNYELRGALSPGLGEMRLILTLKDLCSGQLIWTWPLPMNRTDWIRNSEFAVQRIGTRLTGKVEAHYLGEVGAIDDSALADYTKLVRARWLMKDWSAVSDRRAETLLRSVTPVGDLGLRARIGLVEILNSRELIFPGLGPPHGGVPEALEIAKTCVAEAPERGDARLAFGWSSLLLNDTHAAQEAAEMVVAVSQSNPRRLAAAAEMLALCGDVARGAELSRMVGILDPGTCRVTMGYRIPVALLSHEYAAAADLAERADGAIIFGFAYGAAAAQLMGAHDRARALWHRFTTDLADKWQGEVLPDPVEWFISASSMRWGLGLEWVVPVLSEIAAPVQRQERVV